MIDKEARQRKNKADHYNRNFRDVFVDVVGSPPGSLGIISGCHYKISNGKAWRWNVNSGDWVATTNTVEYIKRMFSTIKPKDSKLN